MGNQIKTTVLLAVMTAFIMIVGNLLGGRQGMIIALVLAGMPFVFGSSRQYNLGFRLFIGMTMGGLFMLVNGSVQNLATAYALPVALGAILPSAVLMVVAITILRRSV